MGYDFRPYFEIPEGMDPQDPVAWTYAEDPSVMCRNWLTGLMGLRGKTRLLPAGAFDDPFLLGFAHGFSIAYLKSWNGSMERERYEYFALEMFKEMFGKAGRGRYKAARRLEKAGNDAYRIGAANAGRYIVLFHNTEEYRDDPLVASAQARATAAVDGRTKADRGSDEFAVWMRDAEDHALYDSLFILPLREQLPELIKLLPSALETMPVPDMSDLLDERDVSPRSPNDDPDDDRQVQLPFNG